MTRCLNGGLSSKGRAVLARIKYRFNEQFRRLPFSSRRREGSLVSSVLLLHFLWGGFVYAMAVMCLWWNSMVVMEDNFEDQAQRWMQTLDEIGAPLYRVQERTQFERIKGQIQGFSELDYVRYYHSDGLEVLGEYQREGRDQSLQLRSLHSYEKAMLTQLVGEQAMQVDYSSFADQNVVRAIAPVWGAARPVTGGALDFHLNSKTVGQAELLGFIDLGLDFGPHKQLLMANILQGSLIIGFVFIAVLIMGRVYLLRTFKPLEDLQGPLARLAHGDMRVKVHASGVKEVNAISEALNSTIIAIRERDQELREMANHDALTKLVNRRYFTDQVISELLTIDDAKRSSAILFLDLDEFKAVNDHLGHCAGDRLLIEVADILQNRVREYDVVSRFGGDEFVILAIGANQREAIKIAESILELMRGYQFIEGESSFNVYCSIGITLVEDSTLSVDQLIKQADSACYQAKARGRNGYLFYQEKENARQQLLEDAGWSNRLREALIHNQFLIHYQAIVSADKSQEEIYEVLLRLKEGGGEELISPQAFMASAERFGMGCDITHWVVDNALEQLAIFRSTGRNIALSINLSGCALEDDSFHQYISKKSQELAVPMNSLIFEIPESFLLHCPERVLKNVSLVQSMGCRIAIDGFGTGLNASGRLKAINFDYLKISRNLMEGLSQNKVNQVLVKAIIELSRVMGKKVVAGFVQDEETLHILEALKVDFVQGYYFAEPGASLSGAKKLH